MNDIATNRRRVVLRQASDWFVRLQDDHISDAELDECGRWMAASPDHAEAFDDLSALWEASAGLKSLNISHARTERAQASKLVNLVQRRDRPSRRITVRWLGGIAAMLIVTVGAWFFFMPVPGAAPMEEVFATERGERRQVALVDGSTVNLDAATEILVSFDKARRDVELRRGQALFSVAHAPERPFVVTAGVVESRALGTQFSVGHRSSQGISVNVLDGKVRVSAPAGSGGSGTWFDATKGQRIDYAQTQGLSPARTVNVQAATAWRDGIVVYQGEALTNVIADLNRYSPVLVQLDDPALGQVRVTGRWELDGTDRWLEGLAQAVGMSVYRTSDQIVLSRKRAASEKGLKASATDAGAD